MPSNSKTTEYPRPDVLIQIREMRDTVVCLEPRRALNVIDPSGRAVATKGLRMKITTKRAATIAAMMPTVLPLRVGIAASAITVRTQMKIGAPTIVVMA